MGSSRFSGVHDMVPEGLCAFTKNNETQQGKKHSEPETGTFINPSPVGERKPWF